MTEEGSYAAQDVYLRSEREGRVPGNLPVGIRRRVEAKLMDEVMKTAEVNLANHPGFSRVVQMWNTFKLEEKLEKIEFLASVDEVKAAITMEMDGNNNNEILELLVGRKRAIEEGA